MTTNNNTIQVVNEIPFSKVPVNNIFFYNGTMYYKRSSRTAHISNFPSTWIYFSGKVMVQ